MKIDKKGHARGVVKDEEDCTGSGSGQEALEGILGEELQGQSNKRGIGVLHGCSWMKVKQVNLHLYLRGALTFAPYFILPRRAFPLSIWAY